MRTLVISCVALAVSSPALAQTDGWRQVADSNYAKAYIREDSIKLLANGHRRAWFRDIIKAPKDKIVRQSILVEFDCDQERSALRSMTSYGADGDVIDTFEKDDYRLSWQSASPETVGNSRLRAVCDAK